MKTFAPIGRLECICVCQTSKGWQLTLRKSTRTGFYIMIAVVVSLLVSCIEITEYVSMEGTNLALDIRLVMQKSLFAMAESMGGSGGSNPADSVDLEAIRAHFRHGELVSSKLIDTDLEVGVALQLRYPAKNPLIHNDTELPLFFPYMDGRKLVIPLKNLEEGDNAEDNPMALAIISGFKLRIMISDTVLANPSAANLVSAEGSMPLSMIRYPGMSLIELSMAYVMSGATGSRIIVE